MKNNKLKIFLNNYATKELLKKNTFLKVFFYTIITSCFVLIICTLILYIYFEQISINDTQKRTEDQLKQLMASISTLNNLMISFSHQLSEDVNISRMMYSRNIDSDTISKGLERINREIDSNQLFHSIFIYNNQRNKYYSSIYGNEDSDSSDIDLPELMKNISEDQIMELLQRKIRIKPKGQMSSTQDTIIHDNVFTVVVGYKSYDEKPIKGALIVNISERKIRNNLIGANDSMAGDIIIIDKKGNILSHPEKEYFMLDVKNKGYFRNILSKNNNSGMFIKKIDKTDFLITNIKNPRTGWIFINISKYRKVFKRIISFRNFSILIFLLLIIISIILALFFAVHIYKPIQKLMQFASTINDRFKNDSSRDKDKNEFQFIDNLIHNLANKLETLSTFKKNKINDLLKDILYGNILPSEIEDEDFKKIKTFFNFESQIMIIISIDRYRLFQSFLTKELINKWYNWFKEIINSNFNFEHILIVLEKGQFAILCQLDGISINQIEKLCLNIQKAVKEKIDWTVTISQSKIFNKETEIPDVFIETLKLLQFKFRYGTNSFIKHENIFPIKEKYYYPEEKIQNMFNELKLGKIEKVEIILNKIFEEIISFTNTDFIFMIQLLSYQTLKMIDMIKLDTYYELDDSKKILERINEIETIDDAKMIFLNAYSNIVKIISSNRPDKKNELITKIKKYIENHLEDKDLCPDLLSSVTGFSTRYVRETFKERMNISLSNYIFDLRINYCKKLLNETSLTIKDISEKSGFLSYNYFFTAFKKYTGLTPVLYRRKRI